MQTRKEYNDQLQKYDNLYFKEIFPLERLKKRLVLSTLFSFLVLIFGILMFTEIEDISNEIASIILCIHFITFFVLAIFFEWFYRKKINTRKEQIQLGSEPVNEYVFVDDVFKQKVSKFDNPQIVRIIDIDFKYSKAKASNGDILTFFELKHNWELIDSNIPDV